ncbi:hypothetical protein [Pelagibius sp. Alg239-R121]|uniref:hypothetical protein n=1 Tax=Pelagibius sp. Alg239-R121 TaxID=2993448 RepID=UPI0024A658A3|nr:hypothetical protein [Pelagibius sp. Alg239-R121]
MNVERADPSYTAWDKRIVSKFRTNQPSTSGKTPTVALASPQEAPIPKPEQRSGNGFQTALYANDRERAYDTSWRTTAAATGSGPAARDPNNEDFGFWDFIDIINPLQHIPVVSTLYRELTGDEISAPARIMGGALYGGPLGFAASIGNAVLEEATGKDAGEMALAMVLEEDTAGSDTAIAEAVPSVEGTQQAVAIQSAANQTQSAAAEALPEETVADPQENAGPAAVSQMVASNTALQALLKDMGLTQAAAPNTSPVGATSSAERIKTATASTHVNGMSDPAAVDDATPDIAAATRPVEPKSRTEVANVQSRPDNRTEATERRKSFPIDPSRYLNARGTASVATTANLSEAAVENEAALSATNSQTLTGELSATAVKSTRGSTNPVTPLQASFADRMLQALDRYQAMSKNRGSLPDVASAGGQSPNDLAREPRGRTPGAI